MKLFFVTQNKAKVAEAKGILAPFGIDVEQKTVAFVEPDKGTVEETARAKLKQVRKQGLDQFMVDDAGIYFAAYKDFPGICPSGFMNGLATKESANFCTGKREKPGSRERSASASTGK